VTVAEAHPRAISGIDLQIGAERRRTDGEHHDSP